MKIEKAYYNSVKSRYKDPVHIMHTLYNSYCSDDKKIPSINKFQVYFTLWLKTKGYTLVAGCLTLIKNYDTQFA